MSVTPPLPSSSSLFVSSFTAYMDVIQSPSAMSQAPHPLLTSHPVHLSVAKNEGVLAGLPFPASMTPPLMANGHQPFSMQTHIHQLSQSLYTSVRPLYSEEDKQTEY